MNELNYSIQKQPISLKFFNPIAPLNPSTTHSNCLHLHFRSKGDKINYEAPSPARRGVCKNRTSLASHPLLQKRGKKRTKPTNAKKKERQRNSFQTKVNRSFETKLSETAARGCGKNDDGK